MGGHGLCLLDVQVLMGNHLYRLQQDLFHELKKVGYQVGW